MNRILLSLVFALIAPIALGANPTEERELIDDRTAFLPLWTKSSVLPSHVAFADGSLYFSSAEGSCGGAGLWQVEPGSGQEKIVVSSQELPCVLGLQEFLGKVVVRYRDAEKVPSPFMAGVQFGVWEKGTFVKQLKDVFPSLARSRGDLAFMLHGIGDKVYEPKQGAVIRKQHFAEAGLLFSQGEKSFLALLILGPKGGVSFHPMLAILPLDEGAGKPLIAPITEWKPEKDLIRELVLGANGYFYFLRQDLGTKEFFLDEVEVKELKRLASYKIEGPANDGKGALAAPLALHFMTALEQGILFFDSPDRPGTRKRSLYFSFADHSFSLANVPARDVQGIGSLKSSFVVARRQGMYWHGRDLTALPRGNDWLTLNATPPVPSPCGGLSVIEGADKSALKIFAAHEMGQSRFSSKARLPENEEVLLGTFQGVSSELSPGNAPWLCAKGALVILAKRFSPNLSADHLTLNLIDATRSALTATDVASAQVLGKKAGDFRNATPADLDIFSDSGKVLLFVLDGPALTLVREAGTETQFDGLRKCREVPGQVDIFLKGEKEELEYKLRVGRTGRDLKGVSLPSDERRALP